MIATLIIILLLVVYVLLVMESVDRFRTFDSKEYLIGDTKPEDLPSTDIIVAAKNEADNMGKFAEAMKRQSHENSRLIFVDDHSSDDTLTMARDSFPEPCRVLQSDGKGKKDALRCGIRESDAEYILSTDADCFPNARWAELMAGSAKVYDADMVMAPVIIEPMDDGRIFQRLQKLESFSMITITGGTCLNDKPVMCNGGNIGYKADFLKRNTDGLNSKYASGDDMFMMETASKQRRSFAYVRHPDAVIRTSGCATWRQLINQRARWVSKTGGYTSAYILFFAFAILMGNLASIACLVLPLMQIVPWWIALPLWLMKFFADFESVKVPSSFYGESIRFWDVLVLEIVYPYYVVASIWSSLTRGFKWK